MNWRVFLPRPDERELLDRIHAERAVAAALYGARTGMLAASPSMPPLPYGTTRRDTA